MNLFRICNFGFGILINIMLISLLFTQPLLFASIFLALVISITFHEFFHVLTARLLGDETGERMGRLTMNPLVHLDLWGTLAIIFIGFGWGNPAPFNPYNLKNQKYGPALVAFGGPFSNFLLIVFFGIILKILYPILGQENYLTIFLQALVGFNGVLMVFNLIPLPPLDGSHILKAILPERFQYINNYLDQYGAKILFGLILISFIFNISIFGFIITPIIRLISGILGVPLL